MFALQRSAGNRAVTGLVEATALPAPRAPVAGIVQRFRQPSAERPDWRRSTNGRIVIYGKKLLFADDTAIGDSNNALAGVAGGAGAYLRLTAGPPLASNPRLKRVVPSWHGREGQVPEKTAELAQINRDDPAKYLSHADCHMTAQTIMGSTDKPSGIEDKEKAVITGLSTPELDPIPKSATEGKMSDHGANRVLDQFLIKAVPEFSRRLTDGLDASVAQLPGGGQVARGGGYAAATQEIARRVADAAAAGKTSVDKVKELRLAYRKILSDPLLKHAFGEIFGINEFANPAIGQALVQFNDEAEKKAEETKTEKAEKQTMVRDAKARLEAAGNARPSAEQIFAEIVRQSPEDPGITEDEVEAYMSVAQPLAAGRDLWNFHWAGVIMKDGSDYVTLENLSVEDLSVKNDLWYFAMYGQREQSFHTEAGRDPHVGNSPLTLPIKAIG